MKTLPNCPKCDSEYTYQDRKLFMCPECSHEWSDDSSSGGDEEEITARDSNGTLLNEGDSISVIKDLKVKGASSVLKVGTKVKNIRLVDGDNIIDCKIDGFGTMKLKSEFVQKV